jgi:RimJ/RimL family protein N-acetyltransferase
MAFDLQPVLRGELLTLRPLRLDDYEDLRAAASDPLIWEQHPDKTRSDPEGFRKFFDEAMASGGAFMAIDNATGAVIGSSRYFGYTSETDQVEIGWTFLVRSRWGGRYNGEMKRLMLTHAFQYVRRVVFVVGTHNIRSQRAVERIGAVPVDMRRDAMGREAVVFAITADSFDVQKC